MEIIDNINNKFIVKPLSVDKIYGELLIISDEEAYHQLSSMQSLELCSMLEIIIKALNIETSNLFVAYRNICEDLEEYKKSLLLQLYEDDLI